MHFGIKLSKKHLMWFLMLSAWIIFIASIEVLLTVKYAQNFGGAEGLILGDFIALNMGLYFSKVIVPIIFSLYSWLVYSKLKVNGLYVFIWVVLLTGNLFMSILGRPFTSPLFWMNLIAYILLILGLVSCIFNPSRTD